MTVERERMPLPCAANAPPVLPKIAEFDNSSREELMFFDNS